MTKISIDEMASFCKKKGFIFQNSEIYGGMAGFFDYGPAGSEMKKNIKDYWWKYHVQDREDVVGIDGAIITHPKVWVASGHVSSFQDIMLECRKCKFQERADTFIEDKLDIAADGLKAKDLNKLVSENELVCPKCKSEFKEAQDFNLMFETQVGPKQDSESKAYLRPETAQLMFTNFKLAQEAARMKLPFGIAQMGRAFRNEISPRNFLFRCREFEQMEIEYFIHPDKVKECPYIKEVADYEIIVYSEDMQKNKKEAAKMKIKQALDKDIIKTGWHAYWLAVEHKWFVDLGVNPDNLRIRQHLSDEKSHYALDTWDLEYNFPFGWKELQGMANRTDFDLNQHIKHSDQKLTMYDQKQKKHIIPYVVAEPSLGVDRSFLVFMFDAYEHDKERGNIVLKLDSKIAPIKAAVFPLATKLEDEAREVFDLIKKEFPCKFDRSGSVGRRYARADEKGIPFCITYDFDSREDKKVTIRNRDTTKQIRVAIRDLKDILEKLLKGEKLEKFGKIIQ
ncbi:glycine--tRNA ligase [Candidatus Woesearchaeota archaeon]|nr:glycine--tRNA ligase [Candidatus Woesearchaeota archaeon]